MMNTFLTARWKNLIMANYEVNPDVLLPYLPKGVELILNGFYSAIHIFNGNY